MSGFCFFRPGDRGDHHPLFGSDDFVSNGRVVGRVADHYEINGTTEKSVFKTLLGAGNFQPLINADEYFDLILFIMLGLGLVFQIPTVTYFLARLGLMTAGTLIKFWRYALIGIFIVAAVVSPTADIPNLLVFAAPMIALYVVSVGIAWIFYKKRQTDEEYEAD